MVGDEQATEMNSIQPEQIDALLPFLREFEREGFCAGNWESAGQGLPLFNFDPVVNEFLDVLYDYAWVNPKFNWPEWQDTAEKYVDCPDLLGTVDAKTIQKLFTTHVRKERFCEGHLAGMFDCGHIVALLHRLMKLRAEMDG